MSKKVIATTNAPAAIGPYSQGVKAGNTVYLSGQIGFDPANMQLVEGLDAQARRVFSNLEAVAAAAGSSLADAVKLTIYLVDLGHFARVNEIMAQHFKEPYPALPRGALIEVDAVLVTG